MKYNLRSLYLLAVILCQIGILQAQDFSIVNTTFKGGGTGSSTFNARGLEYANNTAVLSKYRGWTEVQLSATGHFRTTLYKDQWYLVDPEGYLYFGAGVNSVKTRAEHPGLNLPKDLKNIGLNHLANWSEFEDINSETEKIPYVFRELFLQAYKNESQTNKDLWDAGVIAIFDPEFLTYSDAIAQVVALRKNDPYCIGVFSDNEMPLYSNDKYGDLLFRFLAIEDKTNPNYVAADAWMIERKGEGYVIDAVDDEAFHGYIASTYYKIVNAAIKKYAPEMLYLGSRIHGAAKEVASIYRDSGPYVDVFSVNYYGNYEPETEIIKMWTAESNKPFVISEFYAKGFDVGLENPQGAGFDVPTQADRVAFFENFSIKLLESKGCLGYQWFRFQDDTSNKGLVNANNEWYTDLINSFTKVNKDIYNLRAYLTTDHVIERENGINVLEDSFIRGGDNAAKNYNGTIMEVKKSASGNVNFERNSWLKFDLSSYSLIRSAVLHISGNQSSGSSFEVNVFEAGDAWSESTITWDNAPVQSTFIGAFATSGDTGENFVDLQIDVTEYVKRELEDDNIISFNLEASEATTSTFKISDKENITSVPAYIIIDGEKNDLSTEGNLRATKSTVYPNPLKKDGIINIDSVSIIKKIEVFNMQGGLVVSENSISSKSETLDLGILKSGIYIIEVETLNGVTDLHKLIKE